MRTAKLTYSSDWTFNFDQLSEGIDRRVKMMHSDEWEVKERWFIGSVSLQIGDAGYRYLNTPLLDFGLALQNTLHFLAVRNNVELVVDGGERLPLALRAGMVEVSSGGKVGTCEYADLVASSTIFLRDFIDECTRKIPDILVNSTMERLYRESGVRELGRDRFLLHSQAVRMRNSMQ